jgi:hypothetical protein
VSNSNNVGCAAAEKKEWSENEIDAKIQKFKTFQNPNEGNGEARREQGMRSCAECKSKAA